MCCGLHNLKNAGSSAADMIEAIAPVYRSPNEETFLFNFEKFKAVAGDKISAYIFDRWNDTTTWSARLMGVLCTHLLLYTTAVEQQHS